MIKEANMSLKLVPQMAYMNDNQMIELKKYSTGSLPVYVHPSLYRALKLMFPGDIVSLSLDDTVKSEMGTGSIR